MSPVIEARNLTKTYTRRLGDPLLLKDRVLQWLRGQGRSERFCAVDDASFTVEQGEVVGIVGLNGSGKSTLLRMLSGITQPTQGNVEVRGRVSSLLELGVGFSGEMTGRENIFLNGALLGIRQDVLQQRLDDIIDFSEIRDFIDTPVKFYSSGMYLRLGFAIGVHVDPAILLIDEAFAVGDAGFREKCKHKLYELVDEGKTILVISHELDLIHELCTRALVMDQGRIVADDKPHLATFYYNRNIIEPRVDNDYREPVREDDEDMILKRRSGSGEVTFTELRVLDAQRQSRRVFQPGETLMLEAQYRVHQPVDDARFAVVLYDNMKDLATVSTDGHGLAVPRLEGGGVVRFVIDALPLVAGSYCFGVICMPHSFREKGYRKRWWKDAYDLWTGQAAFAVESVSAGSDSLGPVHLRGHWELGPDDG